MSIKVLIVDDSALMRKVLGNMVQEIDGLDLVEVARNGKDALRLLERMKPDIITLDVEMPVMDGLDTLKEIKEKYDIPVIMLSSRSDKEVTIQALEWGAVDFLEKPVNIQQNWELFTKDLEQRLKVHFVDRKPVMGQKRRKENQQQNDSINALKAKEIEAVVIGASTGGPKALVQVIRALPSTLSVPVFIVQHMPAGFTASFARRLNSASSVNVVEAYDGQKVEKGTVYLAPGGYHMTIYKGKIVLDERAKIHGVRPAVDYLFESASQKYRENLLGVILTGMGNDGTAGCRSVKEAGGYIMTQDKESSVVYGMPRNAAEKGYSDRIANLSEIADTVKEMVR